MKIKTISGAERLSLKRSIDAGTEEQRKTVRSIIEDVKANGDQAVRRYTAKFDGIEIDSPLVTKEEFEEAYTSLDSRLLQVIRQAIENIREYHERQLQSSLVLSQKGRHNAGAESDGAGFRRCICAGGNGRISFICFNECDSGACSGR